MGEFVDDHVASVTHGGRALQGVVPRQDDLPLRPRLAGQCMALLMLHGTVVLAALHQKGSRVHQHLA